MIHEYYSHGKLLLTGEYFVLEGALAFAIPLKAGQRMWVDQAESNYGELSWETKVQEKDWLNAKYNTQDLRIIESSDINRARYLQKLLLQTKKMSSVLNHSSVKITNNIEFPTNWGLGSSSSLISNLAFWANIDPFDLLNSTTEGSGYDIACARSNGPILYQLLNEPLIKPVKFEPDFRDHIYFVYLGKKQDTLKSVLKNKDKIKNKKLEVDRISQITRSLVESETLHEFENYLNEHEQIVSTSIHEKTVKSKYFSDFEGSIKSLGAWGGDFILATHAGDSDYVRQYFNRKSMDVIFSYKDLVL
ncbi:MAG TPA: GHMP kinase [Bacteroidales bacterium]|jgi:mevalonate kinase|nr:GHMP kinase [Bacteroidales bacterium]